MQQKVNENARGYLPNREMMEAGLVDNTVIPDSLTRKNAEKVARRKDG